MAKITESRPPVMGQQHSYSIDPPPGLGCRVTFLINGQAVTIRDEVGGLRVVGFGAAGSMTVEVVGGFIGTTVTARIDCPEVPSSTAGPLEVGSGSFDNCDQEPCKSRRQSYINLAIVAIEQERAVKLFCRLYRFLLRVLLVLFLLFLLATFMVVLCQMVFFVPAVCLFFRGVFLALAAGLPLAAAMVFLLGVQVQRLQRSCGIVEAQLKTAFLNMQSDCPLECRIPEVKINCNC
jgi:hypothetical protein